jgi:uncharacterized membrane protein YkvA (DUF1232 family)
VPRGFRGPTDIRGAIEAVRKLPTYARLVWGLARDGRVPGPQKLILVGIIGYLLMPLDVIPDFIPVLGQLDDVAVVLLGLDLFIKSAPADVVDAHLERISKGRDDLSKDMDQVQSILGDRFTSIRADLGRILDRQRKRYRTPDEAASALEQWQDKGAGGGRGTRGQGGDC